MKTVKEIGIENLKEGQTIHFAKDTWAICFRDEVELSDLKGTIAQNDFADLKTKAYANNMDFD